MRRKKHQPVKHIAHLTYGARLDKFLTYFLSIAPASETQELRDITGFEIMGPEESKMTQEEILTLGFRWKACWPEDIQNPMFPRIIDWFARTTKAACTVRVSTIPNAGYGLFALRDIEEGERFAMYGGLYMSDSYFVFKQTPPSAYIVPLDTHAIIDGELCFRLNEMGRWINDFRDPRRNNCQFIQLNETQMAVEAKRFIAAGEEIGITYGEDSYWCIQCNSKIAAFREPNDPERTFCGKNCQKLFHSSLFSSEEL